MSKPLPGTQINVRLDDEMTARMDGVRGPDARATWVREAVRMRLDTPVTVPLAAVSGVGFGSPSFTVNAAGQVITGTPWGSASVACEHSYVQAGRCLGCGEKV